jgi:hypothetical protein
MFIYSLNTRRPGKRFCGGNCDSSESVSLLPEARSALLIRAPSIIMLSFNPRGDGYMVRQFGHQLALAASDWRAGQRTLEGRKKETRLGV